MPSWPRTRRDKFTRWSETGQESAGTDACKVEPSNSIFNILFLARSHVRTLRGGRDGDQDWTAITRGGAGGPGCGAAAGPAAGGTGQGTGSRTSRGSSYVSSGGPARSMQWKQWSNYKAWLVVHTHSLVGKLVNYFSGFLTIICLARIVSKLCFYLDLPWLLADTL